MPKGKHAKTYEVMAEYNGKDEDEEDEDTMEGCASDSVRDGQSEIYK